jgi:hypothetical protein
MAFATTLVVVAACSTDTSDRDARIAELESKLAATEAERDKLAAALATPTPPPTLLRAVSQARLP